MDGKTDSPATAGLRRQGIEQHAFGNFHHDGLGGQIHIRTVFQEMNDDRADRVDY
jgi:hypothetical protein